MAVMIPENLPKESSTEGERIVFRYLKQLLPDSFQVYVEPDIPTKRSRKTTQPDFVVFGPDFGLLVLEVKDWTLSQIVQADSNRIAIKFRKNRPAEMITNPRKKVRDYCYQVLNQLKQRKILTQQAGPHKGQFCAPFGWSVVFTNITRKELDAHPKLAKLFPPNYTLCRDELLALWKARSDKATLKQLSKYLAQFPFDPISEQQSEAVDYVLSPRWSVEGVKNWIGGRHSHHPDKHSEKKQSRAPELEKPLTDHQVHCLLYTSPSPRDRQKSRMPSSA